jgi:restriction system protein
LLPSGKQARFDNRVAWARAYLKRAGLIENTGRGIFRITPQGLDLLRSSPERIDIKLLKQYPGIQEWHGGAGKATDDESVATGSTDHRTPEEILEASYQELRHSLARELLDRVSGCSPGFFESLMHTFL